MGQVISDVDMSSFAPTANIKADGASLTGVYVGSREIKTKFGPKSVARFKVQDASCTFLRGKEEVFPNAGDLVELIPPTRLARQLSQVNVDDTVLIKYLGKKAIPGSQPAHTFHVEVM